MLLDESETSVLAYMRYNVRFNKDIPGAIENVHPNKFIPNLIPVEDFRHTPIIPISEKELAEHKRKIEEANRKGWYLEIKKDTLYYWGIAIFTVCVFTYLFFVTNENLQHEKYKIDQNTLKKMQVQTKNRTLESIAEDNRKPHKLI